MKLFKLTRIFVILVVCAYYKSYAQTSKTYKTRIDRANNVYIGNNLNNKQIANILLVDKYIKKDKPIKVLAGGEVQFAYEDIKKGSQVFAANPENIIKFRVVGNNLLINSQVKSIDQKIVAIIKDNKLLVSKGLLQRSAQNYIEIIDDYGIPVLQIILTKDNSIEINGVFFTERQCVILSKGSMSGSTFKPFTLMDEKEKQETLYWVRQNASLIKPLD